MYKKFESNSSLGGSSFGSSDDEDSSLQINLHKCRHALKKVCEFYSNRPDHVTRLLESLETALCKCSKFLDETTEKSRATSVPLSQIYSTVLQPLEQETVCCNVKLRLYFNKSPIWEYFHRNLREMLQTLRYCCQTNCVFERNFVNMPQIIVARNWGSLKTTMTTSSSGLNKLLPLAANVPINSSINRVHSLN